MKKIYLSILVLSLTIFAIQAKADPLFQFNNSSSLPVASQGQNYTASINFVYNGSSAISVSESGLPQGISANPPFLVSANNYSIGLSGNPSQSGTFNITVSLSDQTSGSTVLQSFSLNVRNQNAQNGNMFGIKNYPLSSAVVGTNYNNTVYFDYYGSTTTPLVIFNNLPPGIISSRSIQLVPNSDLPYNFEAILSGIPTNPGTYPVSLTLSDTQNINTYYLPLTVFPLATPSVTPTPLPTPTQTLLTNDPSGTNISVNGTVYMITQDGQRRAYTSAGAFLSYGFNSWSKVLPASSADLALPISTNFIPPRDGKIVCSDRGSDKGTCYLISDGKKSAFTSATVFKSLGFSFANTLNGDVSFLPSNPNINSKTQAHSAGVLINKNGTIYLVGDSGLLGIPNMGILSDWGYSLTDIINANTADSSKVQTGIMKNYVAGLLSPL